MKKIKIAIILLLGTITSLAQPAALKVFSDGELFLVSIDGKKINNKPEASVTAFDITAENIRVLVTLPNQNNLAIKQSVMVRPGELMKLLVKQTGKGKWVTRYQGESPLPQKNEVVQESENLETVNINAASAPSEQVQIKTNVNEKTGSVTTTVNASDAGNDVSINASFDGNDLNVAVSEPSTTTTTTITTTTGGNMTGNATVTISTATSETVSSSVDGQVVEVAEGCTPMGSVDFSSAKSSISSKTFEDSKITMAKQIIKANCLKSEQVKQIMKMMGYEDSRLEIAKFAYPYCYDKNNYYKVNDAFQFELTIDELNEFIEAQ